MKYLKHSCRTTDGEALMIFIMREDGKSYGQLTFFDKPKSAVLDSLSVDKSIRRKGEGTRMQKLRESIAKRKGFKEVWLWCKEDSWIKKWYERRGYKVTGKKFKQVKGCIWMKKKI